ncbi:MAG: acyltransferase, partial [Chitinophagaceae bacterium]
MKPARLSWMDYARGIAIILVAYRHVFEGAKEAGIAVQQYEFLEYFNIFFYSFRMPLFFIISGVFITRSLQKRGLKAYTENRARTVLYPYFVWGFLQLSLQMVFTRFTNGHPTAWSYFNLFYQPREIAQFWYLYALFNVSLLYALSK